MSGVSWVNCFPLPENFFLESPLLYYPAIYILPSTGHVLMFACSNGIIIDVNGTLVSSLPKLPSPHEKVCFEFSGSPALLPMSGSYEGNWSTTLIFFGGSLGADTIYNFDSYIPGKSLTKYGSNMSFHIDIRFNNNMYSFGSWIAEEMPKPRILLSSVLLPNGKIVLVNGAEAGVGGFLMEFPDRHRDRPVSRLHKPVLDAWLYDPFQPTGARFSLLATTQIVRYYHSNAVLTREGAVLIAGCSVCGPRSVSSPLTSSITHIGNQSYPVESDFRMEALFTGFIDDVCHIHIVKRRELIYHGLPFNISVRYLPSAKCTTKIMFPLLNVSIVSQGGDSHSTNLGQRVYFFSDFKVIETDSSDTFIIICKSPPRTLYFPIGSVYLYVLIADHHSPGVRVKLSDI